MISYRLYSLVGKNIFDVFTIILSVFLLLLSGCQEGYIIDNPYEGVNWQTYGRYKADLHSHTSYSDGYYSPHIVVDLYRDADYDILAIADHNRVTYPWQEFSVLEPSALTFRRLDEGLLYDVPDEDMIIYEDRDQESIGMLAVQANEISQNHHLGSYFNDHEDADRLSETVSESLEIIDGKGGLGVLFHPGRGGSEASVPIQWYYEVFEKHDNLIGVEAYNSGLLGHQPGSIEKWDSLLSYFMPERTVLGFSNDDFHHFQMSILGRNFNIFLLPELNNEEFRAAMENGAFYFVARHDGYYDGPDPLPPPEIISIDVNSRKGVISIDALNYDFIEWISAGNVVHRGDVLDLSEYPGVNGYVRANIIRSEDEALAGTQPFGIRRKQ